MVHLSLISIVGRKEFILFIVFFALLAIGLSLIFIEIEAFEGLHEFSRAHEDWQLDEYLLVVFAILLSMSFAALLATFILTRRLLAEIRKQLEMERRLAHSQKLQSLGTLLGGVAHSVNNHLLPVLTLTRLVKSELQENSDEAQHLGKVVQAAEGAASILRSVLNFTHQDHSGMSGQCEIGKTVEAAMGLASTAVPSSAKFTLNILPLKDIVAISEVDLEISLLNIITNSVDALDSKPGQISVTLEKTEKAPPDVVLKGEYLKGPLINLKVEDSGAGMTEEQKDRMFDPFYTTKAVGKGTGLGLSETYGIIKKAGGVINVTSTPGQGTEITILVPVKP